MLKPPHLFKTLRVLAIALFVVYIAWNISYILLAHRLPPSLLITLTGIPAPSTGMTRSLLRLLEGNVLDSLLFNPFTIPTIMIMTFTISFIAFKVFNKKEASLGLPRWLIVSWCITLGLAWVYTLTLELFFQFY